MSISQQTIEQMAPDQASLNAASKLMKPAKWPLLGRDEEPRLIWGECQGSGSTPYRVVVDLSDHGYKCSCPSRKFPCKHVLALMWFQAGQAELFSPEDTPQFVTDWLGRRRGKSTNAKAAENPKGDGPSLSAVSDDAPKPRDKKAEARAEAQRERAKEKREADMLAGLDDLDRWIGDQLERGLAAFMADAQTLCRQMAQRLVDAKLSGLATAIDALPSQLFSLPEAERNRFLVERLGSFHLLAQAYRRQDQLSDCLRADVRRLAGWPVRREDLLADPSALRVKADWIIVAVRSEVQPDRLRRIETWLVRCGADQDASGPHFAVLIDFVPLATGGAGSPFTPGEAISAELVFYPSAAPLRALIDERSEKPQSAEWPRPDQDLSEALAGYYRMLAVQPWLPAWPIMAKNLKLVVVQPGRFAFSGAGSSSAALPVNPAAGETVMPMLGLDGLQVTGLWDGRHFSPMSAATPIGRWMEPS